MSRKNQGLTTGSYGERRIAEFLHKKKIKFTREWSFPTTTFRYDFYLPELGILIEYDGEQHFGPVKDFGGDISYIITKNYDNLKNDLAKLHKLHLIRIPYTKYHQIEKILTKEFNKLFKYQHQGKYFKTFLQLAKHFKLPGNATTSNYKKLLAKMDK
jgi:very-short-patch-repair endonuclease